MKKFTVLELKEGLLSLESLINKSEKALKNLPIGSSQWTLLTRRLKAFKMAYQLILNEIEIADEGNQHE